MSLRDQLLKAGLVSAKDKRRAEQELKAERKQAQAHRERKETVEARTRAEQERDLQERLAQKAAERARRLADAEADARRQQVNQILGTHAQAIGRGTQRFWHLTEDRRFCHRIDLTEWMAQDLRAGRLAINAREHLGDHEYVVVSREIALRVATILPSRVVFFNEIPPDSTDTSEELLEE